jgi:hypothetical protein
MDYRALFKKKSLAALLNQLIIFRVGMRALPQ